MDVTSSQLALIRSRKDWLDKKIRVLSSKGQRGTLHVDRERPDLALAEAVVLADGEHGLVLDCGDGLLGLALAMRNPTAQLLLHDDNVGELELARRHVTLNAAVVPNVRVVDGDMATDVDAVVYAPDRYSSLDVIAATIGRGRAMLRAGGRLLLITHKRIGGTRHEAMLHRDFAEVGVIAKGPGGYRLLEARGPASDAPRQLRREISFEILGRRFAVETEPSLFSKDGLDDGTRLLLESVDLSSFDRLLDIGCGWGAIGLVAATVNAQGCVVMVDVDSRAVHLAADNVRRLGLEQQVAAVATDDLSTLSGQFDLILSNPPFHADNATLTRLFTAARQKLRPEHEIDLVIERGYVPRFHAIVEAAFGNVRTHTSPDDAFVVLTAYA